LIEWLERLDRLVFRAGLLAAVICLALVTLFTFAQVVARYVLKSPLLWSQELSSYLFVWLTLLGGAAALRMGAHYGFTLVADRAGAAVRRYLLLLAAFATLAVCASLAWVGAEWALSARDTSSALRLPMSVFYLALPVGALLASWHILVRIVALLKGSGPA
jgi:TRAP-type C4-dicarboxylate transport system permease small subunit